VAALGVRAPRKPRDIDLIRKGNFPVPEDDLMAQRFMSRDFMHGARVELIRDIQRYLNSRDITLNEVAAFDRSVTLSLLAALDCVGHVIRPSQYRGGSIHRKPSLDGRILLKMARLFAEAEHFAEPALLVGIPDEVSFTEFDLAIQLNKAFQQGFAIARGFIDVLVLLGALEASTARRTRTISGRTCGVFLGTRARLRRSATLQIRGALRTRGTQRIVT
jgi:hypothetical protein